VWDLLTLIKMQYIIYYFVADRSRPWNKCVYYAVIFAVNYWHRRSRFRYWIARYVVLGLERITLVATDYVAQATGSGAISWLYMRISTSLLVFSAKENSKQNFWIRTQTALKSNRHFLGYRCLPLLNVAWNSSVNFRVILLTDKPANKQIEVRNITSLAEATRKRRRGVQRHPWRRKMRHRNPRVGDKNKEVREDKV